MHDYDTKFPTAIDDRKFMTDMRLSDAETNTAYQQYIADKDYSQASKCLQDSDADYFGAYQFNFLNRRLIAIGTELLTKTKKQLVDYTDDEPEAYDSGTNWLGN